MIEGEKGRRSELTALVLFAGAGGYSLGLARAGFKIIGFVEKNPKAVKTYRMNFPGVPIVGYDITKIPDGEFEKFKGKVDLISAGFPCEGFSHAGKKDPNDPRNKLFWEFVRATNIIKPRWILGENVFGLLHRMTDDGKARVADVIVDAFESIGYKMAEPKVLNAVDYGVPQKRRRVFFVGNREGVKFEFPETATKGSKKPTIRDVLEPSLEGGLLYRIERLKKISKEIVERFGGEIPKDREKLIKLPGIGDYIANAIMSFAYNLPYQTVDRNVVRIVERVFNIKGYKNISNFLQKIIPRDKHKEFNWSLLDLGRTICKKKSPKCKICPIKDICNYANGV
jgi:DNA-cytosine methyltransferase